MTLRTEPFAAPSGAVELELERARAEELTPAVRSGPATRRNRAVTTGPPTWADPAVSWAEAPRPGLVDRLTGARRPGRRQVGIALGAVGALAAGTAAVWGVVAMNEDVVPTAAASLAPSAGAAAAALVPPAVDGPIVPAEVTPPAVTTTTTATRDAADTQVARPAPVTRDTDDDRADAARSAAAARVQQAQQLGAAIRERVQERIADRAGSHGGHHRHRH